jgi:hypothetical protein
MMMRMHDDDDDAPCFLCIPSGEAEQYY